MQQILYAKMLRALFLCAIFVLSVGATFVRILDKPQLTARTAGKHHANFATTQHIPIPAFLV